MISSSSFSADVEESALYGFFALSSIVISIGSEPIPLSPNVVMCITPIPFSSRAVLVIPRESIGIVIV